MGGTADKEVGAELAKKKIRFVDAPVSGGEPKAIDGTLSIMCGGKKADAGVDPQLVFEAIRGGLAGSTVMNAKAPMMLDRNIKPGFRINLHIKDLDNAMAAGHAVGVALPLTGQSREIMTALKVDGMGDADHSAIVRFYEKLAQVEVKKQN